MLHSLLAAVLIWSPPESVFAISSLERDVLRVRTYRYTAGRIEQLRMVAVPNVTGELQDAHVSPEGKRLLVATRPRSAENGHQAYVVSLDSFAVEAHVSLTGVVGWLRWKDDETFESYRFTLEPWWRQTQVDVHQAPTWQPKSLGKQRIPWETGAPDKIADAAAGDLTRRGIRLPRFFPIGRTFGGNMLRVGGHYSAMAPDGSTLVVFGHTKSSKLLVDKASLILVRPGSAKILATPEDYRVARFLNLWQDLVVFGTRDDKGSAAVVFLRQRDLVPIMTVPGEVFSAKGTIPTYLKPPK
jgi:hypothetical protein